MAEEHENGLCQPCPRIFSHNMSRALTARNASCLLRTDYGEEDVVEDLDRIDVEQTLLCRHEPEVDRVC